MNEEATFSGPPLTRKHTSSVASKETHYKPKKQTPVYNPFDLEQSRPWLVGEGGDGAYSSIAGRRSIVLLVLFSASEFLITFWSFRPNLARTRGGGKRPERCYGLMRACFVLLRQKQGTACCS